MARVKHWTLHCDAGQPAGIDAFPSTATTVRSPHCRRVFGPEATPSVLVREATKKGWVLDPGGPDLCPMCAHESTLNAARSET